LIQALAHDGNKYHSNEANAKKEKGNEGKKVPRFSVLRMNAEHLSISGKWNLSSAHWNADAHFHSGSNTRITTTNHHHHRHYSTILALSWEEGISI